MAAIDYHAIGAAIVSHLSTSLGSGYLVTQSYSMSINQTVAPVAVCVLFQGFAHMEQYGQVPDSPTRDAEYVVGIVPRADSDDSADERLDDSVMLIEQYTSPAGHGRPPFGRLEIERSTPSGARKIVTDRGLTATMTVTVRIMEV